MILEMKDKDYGVEPMENNTLHQCKILFTQLLESEQNYYNPWTFYWTIKDWEGNIPPETEQKDVDEFMNIFMDKIDIASKGTKFENFKNILGG